MNFGALKGWGFGSLYLYSYNPLNLVVTFIITIFNTKKFHIFLSQCM